PEKCYHVRRSNLPYHSMVRSSSTVMDRGYDQRRHYIRILLYLLLCLEDRANRASSGHGNADSAFKDPRDTWCRWLCTCTLFLGFTSGARIARNARYTCPNCAYWMGRPRRSLLHPYDEKIEGCSRGGHAE